MNPLITLLSWLDVIAIAAWINWYIIVKKKKSPVHWMVVLFAAIAAILHGGLIAKVHAPENWVPDDYTMAVLIFYPMSWWSFYDAFLNWMRGLKTFYKGKREDKEEDSKIDNFFAKLSTPFLILTKACALALSIVCFYIMISEYGHS